MSTGRNFTVALLVSVAVLGLTPGAFAADTVTVEDGGTYEQPVTLQFDVPDGSNDYAVRTADGLFVNQLAAENGTAMLDTDHMDPGEYVLTNPDTGETLYTFTLVGEPSTPTATAPATAAETEPEPVRPALRVPTADRSDAVDATDARVFWVGQDLAFRVDGDTSYQFAHDGEQLGRLTGPDHYRYLNTTALEPGMYTVRRHGGHDVYRFSLSEQTLSATATEAELDVTSNRRGFDLVLSSPNASTAQLLEAVPDATRQHGRVVVTDVGSDASIPVETGSLPVGNHTLTLTVADTGTTANATLQVAARNGSATAATATAKGAVSTTAATTTATESSTTTATATATGTAQSASTSVDAPGFGLVPVVIVVLLLSVGVGLLVLSQRR